MQTNDKVFVFSFELISNNFRNKKQKKPNIVTNIFTIFIYKTHNVKNGGI